MAYGLAFWIWFGAMLAYVPVFAAVLLWTVRQAGRRRTDEEQEEYDAFAARFYK